MAVVLSLGAALLYATASVLQHRAAREVPPEQGLRPGLMIALLKRPMWLVGFSADWVAFGLQAAALGVGSLVLVSPLLTAGLLFSLPIGAAWAGRRMGGGDWVAAIALTGGLSVFLVVGDPTHGIDQASNRGWLVCGVIVGALAAAAVLGSRRVRGARRAVLLALATGMLYGITAALTKTTVSLLGDGIASMLTNWEPYALAVVASGGMLLNQSAFHAGALSASLPTLTVGEPIVASIIGATLLDERLRTHGIGWVALAIAVVAMLAGVAVLARASAEVEDQLPATSSTDSSPAA